MTAVEDILADIGLDEGQRVLIELTDGLVEHGDALKGERVHGHDAPLPAAQHQIPVHVELVPGDQLLDGVDQELLVQHEDIHGSGIVRGSGVVHQHIGDLALLVHLHGQVDDLAAVADAGLGNHGHVLAGSHMGSQNGGQVDVGQNGGVGHDHQLVIRAELQEVHGVGQGFQLAPVGVGHGLGVGGQEFQTAFLQLKAPFLTVADVVHQGLVVEPGDDAHMAHTGVAQVGQSEVHLTVAAAEGQGRHGALVGQLTHVGIIGKDNTHYVHRGILLIYSISPGLSTALASTTAPLEVTLIFFFSLGLKAPPTTALRQTLEFSPRMA